MRNTIKYFAFELFHQFLLDKSFLLTLSQVIVKVDNEEIKADTQLRKRISCSLTF